LRAADAVQVEKFMNGLKKALSGGSWRVKSMPLITQQEAISMLFNSYEGRMPLKDATRICQYDVLHQFGLHIGDDGYLKVGQDPHYLPRTYLTEPITSEELQELFNEARQHPLPAKVAESWNRVSEAVKKPHELFRFDTGFSSGVAVISEGRCAGYVTLVRYRRT
jgi:hypothetical protein